MWILILLLLWITGCNPKELPIFKEAREQNEKLITEQTEKAIKNSPELQELDNVCKQIPLPSDFKFVWKGGLDDQKLSLSTHYYSETSYEEAKNIFNDYFSKNNGKLVKVKEGNISKILEYQKENYRVVIQYGGMGKGVNYFIYCEKLKTP